MNYRVASAHICSTQLKFPTSTHWEGPSKTRALGTRASAFNVIYSWFTTATTPLLITAFLGLETKCRGPRVRVLCSREEY